MKNSHLYFYILFLGLFVSCSQQEVMEPIAPAPEAYNQPEASPTPKAVVHAHITYTDITESSGITFMHNNGHTGKKYMPETMGGGCGLFDYDNDGDLDIFFVNGKTILPTDEASTPITPSELYENDGKGNFTNVSSKAGFKDELYGMGCTMADYDGDGDLDIFITSAMDGHRLYRNEGKKFVDVTGQTGLTAPTWSNDDGNDFSYWSTSAVFFDYNKDGWLDLFVCNYIQWSIVNDIHTSLTGIGKAFTRPDLYKGLSPLLYKNNGDGTFADVTKETGIWNPDGKALGVSVEDLNDDGWLDIAVANDAQPNFLYQNNEGKSFTDMALAYGIAYGEDGRARAGMGIDIAYPLAKDSPVIAIGNFSHEPVSFFVRENAGVFIDASGRTRISRASLLSLTFGLAYFDYDYDGWLDFATANGHIEPDIEMIEKEVKYKQSTQMFRNVDGSVYEDTSKELGGDFVEPIAGRGLAYGDIDGDGDLDLLLTSCGEAPRLLRNDGGAEAHNWVRFQLKSSQPNTDAIGSRVIVDAAGKKQTRRVRTGSSYCSQNELILSFGMGEATKLEALTIEWHDGTVKTYTEEELSRIEINKTNLIVN